eukprot:Gb_10996 [translate_table: standard]
MRVVLKKATVEDLEIGEGMFLKVSAMRKGKYMRTHNAKAYANLPAKKVVSFSQTNPENAVGSLSIHKVKRTSGSDWEDNGTKATTRMRGLQDFGLRIAPQKKQSNMAAPCEGIPIVIIPKNGVPCPPYVGCGMGCGSPANNSKGSSLTLERKRSQVGIVQESFVKRRNQHCPFTKSKQVKQVSLLAMPRNNLVYTGISLEQKTTLQATQHIYESKDGHCHSVFVISDNTCSNLSEDMDDKSFLHPDAHVEESTLIDYTPSMGVVTDQGVCQWQSKAKWNIRTLNKKHGESSNGRSFLKTSDACIALIHEIAFDDKVHSSEELRTEKVSKNTYEEPVSFEKDITKMTPLLKMYSLGHDVIPDPIHVGGLRYHGMAPLISHVYNLGLVEALAILQIECFQGTILFARTKGFIPTPELTHAIAAATREGPEILQHPSLQLLFGKAIQSVCTVMIPVVNKCNNHAIAAKKD